MEQIRSTDAKTHFAQLMNAVEQGKSFAVTRHGKTIAHINPPHDKSVEAKQKWLDAMMKARAANKGPKVTWQEAMKWREEDRF